MTDDWIRDMAAGQVHFSDGAAVAKVVLASDLSAVRLHNLPIESTETSVATWFKSLGLDVPVRSIRLYPAEGRDTSPSAVVRVEDPHFAKTLCDKLVSRPTGLDDIEATPIPAVFYGKEALGSSLRDINSKKVAVSWYRPTRTIWLNFRNEGTAVKVQDGYASGSYKILGQQVETAEVKVSSSTLVWTVTLLAVPVDVTVEEVRSSLPRHLSPRHIELGKASFEADVDAACTTVRLMLKSIGALEWWQHGTHLGGKRTKAQAVFFDEADARKAVEFLHDAPLTFGWSLRLTVRLLPSAKFRVLTRIYEVCRARINELQPTWRAQYLRFDEYPPVSRFTTVKIEAEKMKNVVQAKKALEVIFAGDIAMGDNGATLWSPALVVDGTMFQRLRTIEAELGVAVCRDKRKKQLRVFGCQPACDRAMAIIAEIMTNLAAEVYNIELTKKQVEWARNGGFQDVRSALKGRPTKFDMLSSPKRIVVAGCRADYEKALKIVSAGLLSSDPGTADSGECSVCWCPPDDAVQTRCGHIYCRECFENLCHSGASSQSLIECKGSADTCKKPLALAELEEKLDSATSEAVLEESAMSHIKRHPDKFRSCPTPGCEQVYRVGTAIMVVCPDCHVATCSSCHEQHSGMSCGDYKDKTSGAFEASQKIKAELGIKDCPKCKTSIEKIEGCNHMTCECGTHLCWECLRDFESANDTYDHLAKEHGGVFGNDYAGIDDW